MAKYLFFKYRLKHTLHGCFNFDPQFDAEYEPDNWKLAVNNENFRKAMMASMDRVKALTVSEPYNPESLLNNTVTPANFAAAAGKDYTQYDALKDITNGDSFDAAKAVEYRDKAKEELENFSQESRRSALIDA